MNDCIVNDNDFTVPSYSSMFSMFFSPNVKAALQFSNLPFVFRKIPFCSQIEQFPLSQESQDYQRNLAFTFGKSNGVLTEKNLAFFNRNLCVFNEKLHAPSPDYTLYLVYSGMALLPFSFASSLTHNRIGSNR